MALDSRQKRAAVIGVARPWYRNSHPSNVDDAQRSAIGNTYPVATFQNPGGGPTASLLLMNRSIANYGGMR